MVNLKLNSKSHPILGHVSMVTLPESSAYQSQNPSRVSADTPAEIADLFNSFFCLCIYYRQRSRDDSVHTVTSDLTFNESTVLAELKALEVGKATGPDKIPAKLLRDCLSDCSFLM